MTIDNDGRDGRPAYGGYAGKKQQEMPTAVVSMIDTVLGEGEEFEEAYTTMLNMLDESYSPDVCAQLSQAIYACFLRMFTPNRSHIHQLLALVIEPEACTQLRQKVQEQDEHDPFVVSYSNIAEKALEILTSYLAANGPQKLLQAVPRRINNEYLEGGRHYDDLYQGAQPQAESLADFTDDRDRKAMMAEYTPSQLAGVRVAECVDIWQLLDGKSKDSVDSRSRSNATQEHDTMRAWQVLALLCDAWQQDSRSSSEADRAKQYAPSLLTQFKAAPGGVPSELGHAMRWIFQPFTDSTQSSPIELSRQQSTAAILSNLLAELAEAGKIDSKTLVNDMTHEMRQLASSNFTTFVTICLQECLTIRTRVFTRYLQRYGVTKPEPLAPASASASFHGHSHPFSPPRRHIASLTDTAAAVNGRLTSNALLITPEKAMSSCLDRIPREVEDLNATMQTNSGRNRGSALKAALDAMARCTLLKTELVKLYIQAARAEADPGLLTQWQKSRASVTASVMAGIDELEASKASAADVHRLRDIRTQMLAAVLD